MATYAIGDIQGCYQEFVELLERVHFQPGRDQLWLVGDLVNRGPQSLEVLRHVHGLGASVRCVLGNHDLHLIMLAEGASKLRADDTLTPILEAPDRDELLAWLRAQPLVYREDRHVMVHAGLLPQWTVAQAVALAEEVGQALQAANYREFLANLWGSEPAGWQDGLTGWPRLRVIVNAMTRLRFCTPAGIMEFQAKGRPQAAPAGYLPWYAVAGRRSLDHVLLTGHWSALGLYISDQHIALDSGCLWGRSLTAVRLEDRAVFQVPSHQPLSLLEE